MPIYKAPLEDVSFLLNDVFQIDRYDNLPGFSDASADVREAILAEAAKVSEEVLQPLNRVGDLEGCTRQDDGRVNTPKGFKEASKRLDEGARDSGADRARQAQTEGDICAEDGGGPMDRHDESHRAAMRHRSRAAA